MLDFSKLVILGYYGRTSKWTRISSRRKLRKYQSRQIKKHLKFLKRHSDYYKGIDINKGLSQLPIMDKAKMMQNFNSLNTVGIDRDEALKLAIESEKSRDFTYELNGISVGLSHGTSGNKGLFITSKKEQAMWVGAVLSKFGIKHSLRVALFLRSNNNLYESAGKSGRISFKYFDPLKNISKNINDLINYNPNILVAPPSILLELVKAMRGSKFELHLDRIISVAEVLTERDKGIIQRYFKTRVDQIYQCTEGFLGYTCEYGTLHLNEDIVYVEKEYIGDKKLGRFIPIITDFSRTSQPIIRYRLDDILVRSKKKCPCGSCLTAITKIEGREDDIFKFTSSSSSTDIVRVFPDFINRCIIYGSSVQDYRVIQHDYKHLEIQLDPQYNTDDNKESIIAEFKWLATIKLFIEPEIEFTEFEAVPAGVKLKRVYSEV